MSSDRFILRWRRDGDYLIKLTFEGSFEDATADWGNKRAEAIRLPMRQAVSIRNMWSRNLVKIVRA